MMWVREGVNVAKRSYEKISQGMFHIVTLAELRHLTIGPKTKCMVHLLCFRNDPECPDRRLILTIRNDVNVAARSNKGERQRTCGIVVNMCIPLILDDICRVSSSESI